MTAGFRNVSAKVIESTDRNKRSRRCLTIQDKLDICEHAEKNPHLSQTDLAQYWSTHGFPGMAQSTLCKILKVKDDLREKAALNPLVLRSKKARLVQFPDIESALSIWARQLLERGFLLSGDALRAKWRDFAVRFDVPEDEWLSLSNGWLDAFKASLGLKKFRVHGEAGSVLESSVDAEIKRVRKITDGYRLADVYNMDETGLFYR